MFRKQNPRGLSAIQVIQAFKKATANISKSLMNRFDLKEKRRDDYTGHGAINFGYELDISTDFYPNVYKTTTVVVRIYSVRDEFFDRIVMEFLSFNALYDMVGAPKDMIKSEELLLDPTISDIQSRISAFIAEAFDVFKTED